MRVLEESRVLVNKWDGSSARHVPLTRLLFDSNFVSMTDMTGGFGRKKSKNLDQGWALAGLGDVYSQARARSLSWPLRAMCPARRGCRRSWKSRKSKYESTLKYLI